MTLADIIALVEEKVDGRSLGIAKHKRWAELARTEASNAVSARSFHGLYFLYKEAIVTGGSVLDQSRYQIPIDYVDDLSIWYDGHLLVKADPSVMNIMADPVSVTGMVPAWYSMRGMEFEIIPKTPEAGKEIKLFYNAKPAEIPVGTIPGTDDLFSDYFLENWPNLHVFGMAEYAAMSLGGYAAGKAMRDRYNEEVASLLMKNRAFWSRGIKIRLQNWDEFEAKQRHLFPQFGNVIVAQE